jgi:transposase-like protein
MSAQKFFNKVVRNNERPKIINIDKSGSVDTAIMRSVQKVVGEL